MIRVQQAPFDPGDLALFLIEARRLPIETPSVVQRLDFHPQVVLPLSFAGWNLTAVPPEFRPACARPGSSVIVRRVPVTIPHALCDLTRVSLSYPGHGGAVTPAPGHGVGNSKGIRVEVDARTLDVTITVSGLEP